MPNRLIHESSPYLLQHAHNPVDWYPWGEEALQRAKAEDKPILLSIGYSACHWCHVMERESFENEQIAEIMNRHFVNIKVDREERPDLDSIYMAAVQALTHQGGWPMTVFLTPDGMPFYGGTYFPPQDRGGMPGFPRVLLSVAQAYQTRRDEVIQSGSQLTHYLTNLWAPTRQEGHLAEAALLAAASTMSLSFDERDGGFGGAPKFPQPMALDFLLRMHRRTADSSYLRIVDLSLTKMAHGGIYDQLGGGFHRYSTDSRWLVPHFEKMLYDNAQLILVYLHAFQLTGRPLYRRIAKETLSYVHREMTGLHGGFYATQDADSEGHEGKFFVWTLSEIEDVLGTADARLFACCYDVTAAGNWEGKNILHLPIDLDPLASELGLTKAELESSLDASRHRLMTAREERVHPGRDDKIVTSWNALMLKAYALASAVLRQPEYVKVARHNAALLLTPFRQQGRLLHAQKDGQAKPNAYLEDYATLVDGLITLYEVTFDRTWYQAARDLTEAMLQQFWEGRDRCFYDTPRVHEPLISRPRDIYDNATPSGTSVAIEALVRLFLLSGEQRYRDVAADALDTLLQPMTSYPLGFGRLLAAADLSLGPAKEIAIVGPLDSPAVAAFCQVFWSTYTPNAVLAGGSEASAGQETVPLLLDRSPVNGKPAAYVCESFVCQAPITEPAALVQALSTTRDTNDH